MTAVTVGLGLEAKFNTSVDGCPSTVTTIG